MKSGQKGFTLVETLLVLILLAIIGFTGYYVYHTQKNTSVSYNNASNSATATTPAAKASSQSAFSTADAEKLVTNFYSEYISAVRANGTNGQPTIDVISKYGTQNLKNDFSKTHSYDPILCSQNGVDSISILGSSVISSDVIQVNIARNSNDTSATH